MIHGQNCQCGQCRLVRGEKVAGSCAICKEPGMFGADDIVVVVGWELFTPPACRRDRSRVHALEEEVSQ